MIRTTPFHERLTELNDQHLYTHWSGYLSALRYSHAPKHEYFAVRNGVGIFDTSPLFKYRITGPGAVDFLAGVVVRDLSVLRPGRAAYTLWCDDRGFVMEDGVVFRQSDNELLMTAARPMLSWLTSHEYGGRVAIEDVTDDYAMLAVQGPRSRDVLAGLVPEVNDLSYFGLAEAKLASVPVTVSRTGYTGDLGFELTVPADDALAVLDAVLEAGRPHGLRPFGEDALMTLRIEAGLPLTGVEWQDSRTAWTDHDRVTPEGARSGLDAQGRARPQPPLRRQRGDPPRAARRHVALGDDRDRRRLGRLGPPLPRRRRAAHQGRAGARLGAVAARRPGRFGRAGRLRHQLLLLPGRSSATSAWHECGPTWPRLAPPCTWRPRCTTARTWSR